METELGKKRTQYMVENISNILAPYLAKLYIRP
jgi:hypothetical protein